MRLHHYEGYAAPNGIWKPAATGSSKPKVPREFDPDQVDRFDFFVSELIKRGIYINLNLHVGRKTLETEGVALANALPDKDKGVSYFDPRLIALQKTFCRQILTHVNPYLGRALQDEPGVCAVEIANENSLLGMWLDSGLRLPADYSRPLQTRWNAWLAKKYNETSLRAAWTEVNDPLDPNDILAQPLPPNILNPGAPDSHLPVALNSLSRFQLATVTGAEGRVETDAISGPTVDSLVRPGLTATLRRSGTVSWSFQLNRDGLNLQEGQPYTLSFWARADTPRRISVNLWQDRRPNRFAGFTGYADLTVNWEKFTFVFRPSNPDPNHSRLSWNLSNSPGTVQMGEIELRAGGRVAAPPEWTLAAGVPLIDWKSTPVQVARRDFAEFLGDIEAGYVADMRAFLKTELKIRAPIWNTQAQFGGWGGLARESASDAIDVHAYWKHPEFSGAAWSATAWKVGNTSMTTAAAIDPLSAFALFRLPGKPFVMSEWNSGQPNDFGAETLLMAAAYAAWQDWAAVYLFDYHSSGAYNRDRFENFFSIDTHPVKMATAPAAALLFRRPGAGFVSQIPSEMVSAPIGDLATAEDSVTLWLPRDLLWHEVASFASGPTAAPVVKTWRDAGATRSLPLQSKVYIALGGSTFASASRAGLDDPKTLNSDTGQLRWDRSANTFAVNAPRSKVVVGTLGGKSTYLDELQIAMPPSQSNWAAFALSSLDGADIARSKRLLLTVAGKAENVGMTWNADRSSVGTGWGSGPTQVEGVIANLHVLTDLKRARVFALDETGQGRSEVPSTLRNGVLSFAVGPQWKTLWYEIAAA